MPPICNYSTYFYRPESDPFTNSYAGCLASYVINMSNPTAEKLPAKIPKEIYAVTMEGIPTAYLLWHLMASVTDEGGDTCRLALRQSVPDPPGSPSHAVG